MSTLGPVILWFRRDLRLRENPALIAAAKAGAVIPVFVLDEVVETHAGAPKWRLGLGVGQLAETLQGAQSRLILRRGKAADVLRALARETGAKAVHWNRLYDPDSIARDKEVKSTLHDTGVEAVSHNGHLLFEPWEVETKQGGFYKVYSPFWRAVKDRHVPGPRPAPDLDAPADWPVSDTLDDWKMGAEMRRGAQVVARHVHVGEDAASARLHAFTTNQIDHYKAKRDYPASGACSGLSENLTYGEISPRAVWHAGLRAWNEGKKGAEHFLKELVWREFAYHLLFHTPRITDHTWREEWRAFDWRPDSNDAKAWRRGMTGEPFVDAAMRQMYVTGTMHNRARMIVASYLTKHLLTHWRVGQRWFEECLIDWDPASNALGWQWVAGSGPDAAPYFRVFNPATQVDKFDPDHAYLDAWIAEGRDTPSDTALSYFDAVPQRWGLSPDQPYPDRIVGLKEGRERALLAYQGLK